MALTDRQARFVDEYLADLNGRQAAIRAGYAEGSAEVTASRLLTKAKVAEAIQRAMQRRSERVQVTQDEVLKELCRIAFSDLREVLTWGPEGVKLRDSGELDDDAAAAIGEISETRTLHGGTLRVRLHDKLTALDRLARHLGLFSGEGRPVDPLEAAAAMKGALWSMMAASGGLPFPGPAGGNGDAQAEEADDDEPDES